MLALLISPRAAAAQSDAYTVTSVAVARAFEHNLFAVPSSRTPANDLVLRVSPAFEAGYLAPRRKIVSRYGFAAEHYGTHAALTRPLARQELTLDVRQSAMRRLSVDAGLSLLETHAPQELNLFSGLTAVRARATRAAATAGGSYNWTPRTMIALEYAVRRDTLKGAPTLLSHEAQLTLTRGGAGRDGGRLEYRYEQLDSDDGFFEASHVLAAGWSRQITRLTAVDLAAGPRVTERVWRPELAFVVRHRLQRGEIAASVDSTRASAVGTPGGIDLQRVAVTLARRVGRRFTITAGPAFTSSTPLGSRMSVYALGVEATAAARPGLAVVLSGRAGVQRGTFNGVRDEVPTVNVSLNLIWSTPRPAAGRRVAA